MTVKTSIANLFRLWANKIDPPVIFKPANGGGTDPPPPPPPPPAGSGHGHL